MAYAAGAHEYSGTGVRLPFVEVAAEASQIKRLFQSA